MSQKAAGTVDWCDETPDVLLYEVGDRSKPLLLGLPCTGCGAYYEAELTTCPVCGCSERVSPIEAGAKILVTADAA